SKTKPFVTVTVARESLPGRLRRGDTVGPCVYGSVRSGGGVSLRTTTGSEVKTLNARRLYSIVVSDLSRIDNFHLSGEIVDRRTGFAFRGIIRWRITFVRGRYWFGSDAHPARHRTLIVR